MDRVFLRCFYQDRQVLLNKPLLQNRMRKSSWKLWTYVWCCILYLYSLNAISELAKENSVENILQDRLQWGGKEGVRRGRREIGMRAGRWGEGREKEGRGKGGRKRGGGGCEKRRGEGERGNGGREMWGEREGGRGWGDERKKGEEVRGKREWSIPIVPMISLVLFDNSFNYLHLKMCTGVYFFLTMEPSLLVTSSLLDSSALQWSSFVSLNSFSTCGEEWEPRHECRGRMPWRRWTFAQKSGWSRYGQCANIKCSIKVLSLLHNISNVTKPHPYTSTVIICLALWLLKTYYFLFLHSFCTLAISTIPTSTLTDSSSVVSIPYLVQKMK